MQSVPPSYFIIVLLTRFSTALRRGVDVTGYMTVAKVVTANIAGAKSYIHIIDAVLVPNLMAR